MTQTEQNSKQRPVFYYDLGSVECYLIAEQIVSILGEVPIWQPVVANEIAGLQLDQELRTKEYMDSVDERAKRAHLQPLLWPDSWPNSDLKAMQAATYAVQAGKVVAFSLAAFRQAFAGGRDLSDIDTVLLAGAACEIHPNALLKGLETKSVNSKLTAATEVAYTEGVRQLPAVTLSGKIYQGTDLATKLKTALND